MADVMFLSARRDLLDGLAEMQRARAIVMRPFPVTICSCGARAPATLGLACESGVFWWAAEDGSPTRVWWRCPTCDRYIEAGPGERE